MKKSFFLLHLSVLLAGFTGIFAKLISLNEGLLVWYRMLFSFVLLYAILRLLRMFISYPKRDVFILLASGMLPALHWIFFYGSIKYSNVSVGVVCFCLTGFFTALISPLVTRQKISVTELVLSALTLLGVGLIFHFDTSYRTGIVLGVISSFFAALYTLTNEKLVKHYDTKMINFYQMMGGTIGLGLLLPLYLRSFPTSYVFPAGKDVVYLLMLALFCTIGLYLMVAEILKKISAFTVNLTFNIEPVYSILLAMLIFEENKELTLSFYIGLFIIIGSVVLQMVLVRIKHTKKIGEENPIPLGV